jgi:hypothetical protein
MQMVGQDHPSLNLEGPFGPRHAHGLTQTLDLAQQQIIPAPRKRDGEKDAGGFGFGAQIL